MRRFLVLLPLAFLPLGCREAPSPIFQENLDRERLTRVNFRPDGETIRSSNVLATLSILPVGTPARVTFYSDKEIRLILGDDQFKIVPLVGERFPTTEGGIDAFLDKYFVDPARAVSVDDLGPAEMAEKVLRGQATVGMTKEQVYACLGPPFQVDEGRSAVGLTRGQIIACDHWIYPAKWVLVAPDFIDLYFGDGLLQKQVP